VNEPRAVSREEMSALVADDSPVADGDEVGSHVAVVDGQVLEDAADVLRAAAVLDVEENSPTRRRPGGEIAWRAQSVIPAPVKVWGEGTPDPTGRPTLRPRTAARAPSPW